MLKKFHQLRQKLLLRCIKFCNKYTSQLADIVVIIYCKHIDIEVS